MTREQMEANGYVYAGTCNCDGVANFKYTKDGYLFYIRPKRGTFHIKKITNYIKKHIPISLFDKTVKELYEA